MRKLLLILITGLLFGCIGGDGELHGVVNREVWYEPQPFGMAFIKMGSYNMGPNDQDVPWAMTAEAKTVSVPPFWMDITEITNNEYRQFVFWVRDSLIYNRLIDDLDHEEYDFMKLNEWDEGTELTDDEFQQSHAQSKFINWNSRIPWDVEPIDEGDNKAIWDAIKSVYYQGEERFYDRWELDARKLNYVYYWIDLDQAASIHDFGNQTRKAFDWDELYDKGNIEYDGQITNYSKEKGKFNEFGKKINIRDRSSYIMHDVVNVYPDTLCWISDFTYSYNDPQTKMYFWHPAYDHYPVVGVTWKQATAFSIWRTNLKNHYLASFGETFVQDFELPTESQWEYGARGGLRESMYPWGGYYTTNPHGCYIANFKPMRGNYLADGGFYPVMVAINDPNDYGLYDMAGNVAEWTSNAYDESAYSWTDDLSPDYHYNSLPNDLPEKKRKVIRGGSWKDIAYYLQCGTRTYEYEDTAKSYIGFRTVRAYLGRDINDSGESQVY